MIMRLFDLSRFIVVYWRRSSGLLDIWWALTALNIVLTAVDPDNSNQGYLYLKYLFYVSPICLFFMLYFSDKILTTNHFYAVFRMLKPEVALSKLIVLYCMTALSSVVFLFSIAEPGNSGKFLVFLNTFFATVSLLVIIQTKWLKGIVFILGTAFGNGVLFQIPEKLALLISTVLFLASIKVVFSTAYVNKI